jgi:pilus assembly protein CpaB
VRKSRTLLIPAVLAAIGSLLLLGGVWALDQARATSYALECAARMVPAERVEVVVATRELLPGFAIREEDLGSRSVLATEVPAGTSQSAQDLIGRVPIERILPEEWVREERLALPDAGRGLAAIVPRGWRAQAVAIDQAPGGAGFVFPGDRIDIYATALLEGEKKTFVLLEDVFVLTVNGAMSRRDAGTAPSGERRRQGPAVTVLVKPDQALQLTHAARLADLQFALRSRSDRTQGESLTMVDVRTLLGLPVAPTPHPSVAVTPGNTATIQIIRGDTVTTEVYPMTEGATL